MAKTNFKILFIILIIIIVIFTSIVIAINPQHNNQKPIMYGSYSCPHCIHQKELINLSEYEYVECNIGIKGKQADVCTKSDIRVYPTWIFSDNTKVEGVITQEQFEEYAYGNQP